MGLSKEVANPIPQGLLPNGAENLGLSCQLSFQKKPEVRIFMKRVVCQIKYIYQPKATSGMEW